MKNEKKVPPLGYALIMIILVPCTLIWLFIKLLAETIRLHCSSDD